MHSEGGISGGPAGEASDKMCNLLRGPPGWPRVLELKGSGTRIAQGFQARFAGTQAPHGMERGFQNLAGRGLSPLKGTASGGTIKNASFLKQAFFFFFSLLTEQQPS